MVWKGYVSVVFFLGGGVICVFSETSAWQRSKKTGSTGSCSCFQLFFLLRFKVGRKARIVKLTSEQGQATGRDGGLYRIEVVNHGDRQPGPIYPPNATYPPRLTRVVHSRPY